MFGKVIRIFKNKVDEHTFEVAQKAFSSSIVKVIGMIAGVLVSAFLGRTLGADGLGIINLTIQITNIIVIFSLLGVPQFLIKELSISRSKLDWKRVGDFMKSAYILNGIVATIFSLILISLSPYLANNVFKEEYLTIPLIIAAAVIVPQVFSRVMSSGLIAYRKIWQSNMVNESMSLVVVGFLLIICWLFNFEITLINVALFYAVGRICVTIFVSYIWKSLYKQREEFTNFSKPLFKSSLPFLMVSATLIISTNIDSILIGSLSNVKEVGLYTLAARLALLNVFFLQVVNSSTSPKLAVMYSEGKIKEINTMVQKVTTGLLAVSILPTLFFIFLGKQVLQLWGDEFVDAYWMLIILSVAQVFNIGTGSAGIVLIMSGHERLNARILTLSIIFKVVVNPFLIIKYGAIGAAFGTMLTIVFENVTKVILARKYTGISTLPFKF